MNELEQINRYIERMKQANGKFYPISSGGYPSLQAWGGAASSFTF